ncbi:MAG: hypothetical protein IKR39_07785 [Lachnospiraceae bacterium]|nr:hypothetical protein [Lachnospiraceae bacterium]
MSAIWGAIDFSGKEITEKTKSILKNAFNECAIDKTSEISDKNVYMGCGLQFFTPESKHEELPTKSDGVYYTADAVLDNRDEMCAKLGIKSVPELGDAEIIRQCFERFGKDCLNDMLGAYVFVRFNSSAGTVDIVADAVGNRYIQYFCEDDILYFSSLRAPLESLKKEVRLNKKWIAYYYGVNTLDTFYDSESTIIDGIYRIAPASHIVIQNGRLAEKNEYWDVTNIKRYRRHKNDSDYRKEFVDLYRKCVSDTLRTDEEVAIFLSGGYDSTSVACLAAPILKERGKKLYSFTSVPESDYVFDGPETKEADEFESVKRNMEFLGNVECDTLSLKGVNLWDIRHEYNKVVELPYKSPENMIWLYEGYKKAREKGARLILAGAFGNGTVSYNNILQYLVWLVKHFKFKKYIEEVNGFNKRLGSSRKRIIKATLDGVFNASLPNTIKFDAYKDCYAYESFLKEHGAIDAVKENDKITRKSYHNAARHQDMFLPAINFRHYGEFPFKNTLYTGVFFRDPTRDKRMIEYVKSLPYDQFTHNGYTRRLIREYMEDIMPPKFFIRHPFGIQSADMKFRFEKYGDAVLEDWRKIASTTDGKGIVDTARLFKDIEHKNAKDFGYGDILKLFYTINALEYTNNYKL